MRKLELAAALLLCQSAHSLAIGRDARHLLRSDSPPVLPVPTRPLPWNEVNFISTSDTHGELGMTGSADVQAGSVVISMYVTSASCVSPTNAPQDTWPEPVS